VAIGNFDGVHVGHQALAARAVQEARRAGGAALALTFDPHPARILAPERAPRTLLTLEQRAELLGGLGVDLVAVLPFDAAVAAMTPVEFARAILQQRLQAAAVVVGRHFRFGRGRAGDVSLLERLAPELGFHVAPVEPVILDGEPVSSSRIRKAIADGDVAAAKRLLGREPFLDGRVVRGEGRGRELGVPTANLEALNELLPAPGVYAGRVVLPGESQGRPAVVNIGSRPTFGGGALTLEAHILSFAGDLYDRSLRLHLAARLRDERRFASKQALVEQIRDDVAQARAILEPGG
jgi:riboflavin kinase/FMN adenylyltransferase